MKRLNIIIGKDHLDTSAQIDGVDIGGISKLTIEVNPNDKLTMPIVKIEAFATFADIETLENVECLLTVTNVKSTIKTEKDSPS